MEVNNIMSRGIRKNRPQVYSKYIWKNTQLKDLPGEIWKKFKPDYSVSNMGRVRFDGGNKLFGKQSIDVEPYILNQTEYNSGYLKCGQGKVHKLVLNTFVTNIDNKPSINHIDGNKKNNRLENLEYATYSEQQIHARKLGLYGEITEKQRLAWHNNGVKNIKKARLKERIWINNEKVNKFILQEELNLYKGWNRGMLKQRGDDANVN